ncbi:ATP-grasp domain-containing protein [Cupriavidus gilardii]|uniref:acetyl-CoA carboxylase biotin carboxylase subunit n=1 Tax=Cupriavidus gilardii TaxID=82541 RepID=UPI001EE5233D|nr:biotin carboxylase N-terminal domain-containing protein [Cupriavidus gilardii]MCG5259491.1 ATP-grasp domain-containing protein [Cupriavidus gilardii]MDF9429611.1 ATP-grasp domain-containing protein [Cupriavidus gilardii]
MTPRLQIRPLRRVLVANRGAVAARILRALNAQGIESIAVYSDADAEAPYLQQATVRVRLGEAPPLQSYLNQDALLQIAREHGADGVHPGYGFLSENAGFAERVEAAGLCFIGPSSRWIRRLGHKTEARALMATHGMPMTPSSAVLPDDPVVVAQAAARIGYPVLIKPAGGGGGIGMLPARDDSELATAWQRARSVAQRSFGQAELYLEKLIERPRHIEFQVLADRYGGVRVLGERDCSVQRRHQKVIEEARAPNVPADEIDAMARRLATLLATLGYDVIGTVEMLYTRETGFVFLELNTRLQVEHAVTEQVTGIDIVAAQLRLARGEPIEAVLPAPVRLRGHAIEARVYAEDPVRFLPSPGPLTVYRPPVGEGVRVETGYAEGGRVTPYYDPMLAKVIATGADRPQAIARLRAALDAFAIDGVKTNIPFIQRVLADDEFIAGRIDTGLAQRVLSGGTMTTGATPEAASTLTS